MLKLIDFDKLFNKFVKINIEQFYSIILKYKKIYNESKSIKKKEKF